MIPIQTLLALLAVLVMMSGCSQVPPPKPKSPLDAIAQGSTNNNTGGATASPSPSGNGTMTIDGHGPQGKPDNREPPLSKEAGTLALDGSDPKQMTLVLGGGDAQNLYRMTEIEAKLEKIHNKSADSEEDDALKYYVKTGQHYRCIQDKDIAQHICKITLNLPEGLVTQLEDPTKIKHKPVGLRLQEQWKGTYVNFNLNPETPTEGQKKLDPGPYFQIVLYNDTAKKIYDSVSAGDINGTKYAKQVRCVRDVQKAANDATAYSCTFLGTLTDGHFDFITPPKAN